MRWEFRCGCGIMLTSIEIRQLKEKRLFLLDMDGTIYLDNRLFDGTAAFLEQVRHMGGRYLFLTNNSSKSVDSYIQKLAGMGIAAAKEDFLTSTDATIVCLKAAGYRKIYAFGTRSFQSQLCEAGLCITTQAEDGIDCLCMGFDTELTFQKLEDACILLRDGAVDYIATNPDWVCPTWYGSVPDCGSVSAMLYNATGRKPRFIGKPQPAMVELALQRTGFDKSQAVLIGDRLYTDIACGVNAGISTIFVLSGEGTRADIAKSAAKPDFVMDSIADVTACLQAE